MFFKNCWAYFWLFNFYHPFRRSSCACISSTKMKILRSSISGQLLLFSLFLSPLLGESFSFWDVVARLISFAFFNLLFNPLDFFRLLFVLPAPSSQGFWIAAFWNHIGYATFWETSPCLRCVFLSPCSIKMFFSLLPFNDCLPVQFHLISHIS